MKLALLNGPNLNLLGVREPSRYGTTTLAEVEARCSAVAAELGAALVCAQSNHEGGLVDAIHGLRGACDGVVINAGAYSHSSLAIRDALVGCALPFVEVHVTNVHAREPERQRSMLASAAVGTVTGLGAFGYELALRGLVAALRQRGTPPS